MTEKLQQTIKEELAKLPKENQTAINAFDWVKVAEEIGEKSLLSLSEINDFQVETLLVLVGIEGVDSYATNIENEVGTSKNEAEKIATEVIQKIFTPISDTIVENIKKSEKIKNSNHEQNLNFILSGGDYSAFVNSPLEEYSAPKAEGGGSISPSPSQGEGSGVRSIRPDPMEHRVTPEEGNNTEKFNI